VKIQLIIIFIIIISNSNKVYYIIYQRIGIVSTTKNKRIMIIDDDEDITNLFSIFLEHNGYSIDAYINPVEAFNNFRKNSHDLIILDLKMPKMDGMTLYHKIKEIDSNVIICFTTADINYIADLRKGIIDIDKIVLYKPILLKDLKNKIDWLLSHQEVHSYGFLS
jgi:DNA-binding response OmpR family regulator